MKIGKLRSIEFLTNEILTKKGHRLQTFLPQYSYKYSYQISDLKLCLRVFRAIIIQTFDLYFVNYIY